MLRLGHSMLKKVLWVSCQGLPIFLYTTCVNEQEIVLQSDILKRAHLGRTWTWTVTPTSCILTAGGASKGKSWKSTPGTIRTDVGTRMRTKKMMGEKNNLKVSQKMILHDFSARQKFPTMPSGARSTGTPCCSQLVWEKCQVAFDETFMCIKFIWFN